MIAGLRRRRGDLLWALLAGGALTLVALLTPPQHVRALDTYSAADVRSGGYRAWDDLLQSEGVAVEHFKGRPIALDGTIDTLIDAYGVAPLPPGVRFDADTRALADWVRAGGRLILIGRVAALDGQESALLLRPAQRAARVTGGPLQARVFGGAVRSVAPSSNERFAAPASRRTRVLLADRGGALIERVALGHGAIVYVSDPRLFANAALGKGDNARLAYLLARPRRPGRIVAFDESLHGSLVERGWLQTLGTPLRVTLAGVAFAVAMALAGGALRLGPPLAARFAREPASDEFIAALAALYQRARARRAAIALLAGDAAGAGDTDADLLRAAVLSHALRKDRK